MPNPESGDTGKKPALIEHARAKVNLSLQIVGKREDGYHLLDSLVVFPPIGDRLSFAPSDQLTLTVDGPFAAALGKDTADNLVLRAARLLQTMSTGKPGAAITLTKALPVASGIGGGSADAAACLRGLNRLWGLGLSLDRLADIGLELGADVPVCVYSTSARMEGIGEKISLLPGMPCPPMVLVNPGAAVSTPDIFRALTPADRSGPLADPGDPAAATNDLQAAAISLCPGIRTVLERLDSLPGVRLARMSGSGATCFALFDDQASCDQALTELETAPDWVILPAGETGSDPFLGTFQ